MGWVYSSSDGRLLRDGRVMGVGYSGTGPGRNNPEKEELVRVGPIPRGRWRVGNVYKHKTLGPIVMNLEPLGHDAHGRSAFRIHGDNSRNDASEGCIILNRGLREMISRSDDKILEVV